MKSCNMILTEKQQKYQHCLTGEEILPLDQSRLTEQATFTYSSLGKAFEKQIKTIEDQRKEQVEALGVLKPVEYQQKPESNEGIFPKNLESSGIKNEINEIKKLEEQNNRTHLIYELNKYRYDFRSLSTIRSQYNIVTIFLMVKLQ